LEAEKKKGIHWKQPCPITRQEWARHESNQVEARKHGQSIWRPHGNLQGSSDMFDPFRLAGFPSLAAFKHFIDKSGLISCAFRLQQKGIFHILFAALQFYSTVLSPISLKKRLVMTTGAAGAVGAAQDAKLSSIRASCVTGLFSHR
jgi:hypothetical protein